ncbi:splicing factor 3A subunit 1-like [Liolophura sinensis]|uniref:splicing factor 3A subunit 1-like n=1 Tax=Liolophura sinensis TaxID=3198878 RepID=UPI00315820D5
MPAIDVQMPLVEEEQTDPEEPTKGTVSKPVIGIIYPPPEVRNIVDKTASFVARNGPEFESRIRQNEVNNPKFNFLNPADPYHAYYQHKVKEFKEGKGQEPPAPKPSLFQSNLKITQDIVKPIQEIIVPKDPPAEFEFIADPPSISAFDLDVVKLTAQFVARNGRQFLTNLMNREQRNYQFDFLRPQHSLFNYFTKLVEQYTKILIPPKDLLNKLKQESENPKAVLDEVNYRVEWAKHQDREKRKEEEAQERERVAYAQIDWHDFVVVETVDFQPNEQGHLPPPTSAEEVGVRVLQQERFDKGDFDDAVEMEVESDDEDEGEVSENRRPKDVMDNTQVQDMEEDSDDEMEIEKQDRPKPPPPPPSDLPNPPPLPPTPDQVVVRKDYNPKARPVAPEPTSDQYMISPITGEKIPAHKVHEHMRIGLLDPKWIEERNRSIHEKRDQEEVYAPGSAIEESLKHLAERRTDIFGSGAEETQIGKKIGEEEKREIKVVWDGHTASMEKVTQKARENISIEDQIAVIHKVKGLVPDEEKEKIGPAKPNQPLLQAPKPPPPMTSESLRPPKPPPPMPAPMPTPMAPPPMPRPPMMTQPVMMMPPRPPMQPFALGLAQPPMHPSMHQGHGFPPMRGPMPHPGPPPKTNRPPPPPMEEEPASKKQKTEESLIPEDDFLRTHNGPVTFKVQVPNLPDKPEWKLNGQMLNFTLPLTDNVSVLKAKVNEALGMPAGKQKLQYEGIFIKDSNTLAYYNFLNGSCVSLQLKERGGRKK